MCGIIGFNFEDRSLAQRMCDIMVHRGPDGEGYYLNKNITLGHRRLSIIDLHTGDQPMYNEDGSVVIVYNGEIYNFLELRSSLETRGHRFTTESDTEVIIHAYEEYGYDCVKLFNGMFAFALYDAAKEELFLARDRCGVKPLHYTMLSDGTFLFGSEIKSILQYKRVPVAMDPDSLHFIINLRYIPGEKTMFRGIKRLLPGHSMILHKNQLTIQKYWEPSPNPGNGSEEYYIKTLRKCLEESVQRHLISDVPVGIMLSGGIDSSSVVALACQMMDEPPKTFCMGFGHANDENCDARLVAEHFGTDHHELIVDDHLLRDYPKMIWYADEPKRNLYPFYISEMVGQHVKTALGGLGADELFGGYIFKYDFARGIEDIRRKTFYETKRDIESIADRLIRFQIHYGNIVEDGHLDYLEMIRHINSDADLYLITQTQDKVFQSDYLEKIYGEHMLVEDLTPIREIYRPFFANHKPFLDNLMLADFREKMIDDFLLVDDRMSMAHSVESRVPFLDTNLVDFALTIPTSLKTKDPGGKHLLKMAMKDLLPKEVLMKKKQGFASGTYDTYLKEGREMAENVLCDGALVREGFIKKDYLEKILRAIPNPRLDMHYGVLWNMLACEIWYGMYINTDQKTCVK
ncbi:asparagine synthase (glutamine-hydrolyzing) [Methanocalculus sp.]|uniref:asparagine synthase (glutamine-hydrolyzing) n=1 Tax=Methanocalculus sp. TaxID=2004547 RepID=UPI002636374A|nr:asparagine synthase (glutamine-hydrolyzing) [Methanocalculus sp.]MDG6251148.1 asparagine synthase (glutamine-hydrolyzing) [Methanocalculus sp.]